MIDRKDNHLAGGVAVHMPETAVAGCIRNGPGTAHRACPGPAVNHTNSRPRRMPLAIFRDESGRLGSVEVAQLMWMVSVFVAVT